MGGLLYEGDEGDEGGGERPSLASSDQRGQNQPGQNAPRGEPVGVRKYLVLLQDSLAIKFSAVGSPSHQFPFAFNPHNNENHPSRVRGEQFKTMESRMAAVDHSLHALYLYKGFREANLQCYWNGALNETFANLEYKGYIVPSTILVTALPRFLNILRTAWARQMLRSPPGYRIQFIGEIEELMAEPIGQGQFAPLSDSLCWAIFELTSIGEEAFVDSIMSTLKNCFPWMSSPSKELVYQTLEKLIRERKVYQTAHGYFVVTADTFRYMTTDPSASHFQRFQGTLPRGDDRMFRQNQSFTLDALNSHNYESDKTSFSQNSWDSAANSPEQENSPNDLLPQGRKLKRHNSLKTFRQKDIAGMQTSEPFGTRSSSMRLSKSKSCGRVDDDDDENAVEEELIIKVSKSRRSTLSQLTSLVRNLKVGSGGGGTEASLTPKVTTTTSADRSRHAKGKWLFRKIFGRSGSKSRESSSSSSGKSSSSPVEPLRCESVETQTSSSTEQLPSVDESSSVPAKKISVNSSQGNSNSPPRQRPRPLDSPVYDEPRPRLPSGRDFPSTSTPCNFPTFNHHHHNQREESSRCSTLSQATSSLGYGSQGYPSLNMSNGSYNCNSPGHSPYPCPYDLGLQSPQEQEQSQTHCISNSNADAPSSSSRPSSSSCQPQQPQPSSSRQTAYEFYRRRYPSYTNSFSRSSPHYSTLSTGSSKIKKPSPAQYESLLTTANPITPSRPICKPPKLDVVPSRGITPHQQSTSTVTQNMKSTTNMELELLLPLGNIMKAALNAKKQALKEDFFRKEFNREPPPQIPDDKSSIFNSGSSANNNTSTTTIPVNLENSGLKLRVGEPKTLTEIKTTVDNNGLIQTHFQSLPTEINQLKSQVEITLNEGGNVHISKVSTNPLRGNNRVPSARKATAVV